MPRDSAREETAKGRSPPRAHPISPVYRSSPRTPPTDTPIEEKPMPELLAPNLLAGMNIPSLNPFFYNSPFFNPYLLMGQMSPYRLALSKPYPM